VSLMRTKNKLFFIEIVKNYDASALKINLKD